MKKINYKFKKYKDNSVNIEHRDRLNKSELS